MKKKIGLGILFLLGAIALVPVVAAFEAHILNVTATIDNALFVPLKDLLFGTVFPQEKLDKEIEVSLSQSYLLKYNNPTDIQWAWKVVSSSQGLRKDGTPVLPDRSDQTKALGPAESNGTPYDNPVQPGTFYSLGFGGTITLEFENFIVNAVGPDIRVFEVTGGTSYPDEIVKVEISQDGATWVLATSSASRDAPVDLGALPWARFVRLTDVSDIALFEPTADGYDLDGVSATSREVLEGDVHYVIRQKPQCIGPLGNFVRVQEDEAGNFYCPLNSVMMPVLCPYLSKHEITLDPSGEQENDSEGITAFHGLPGAWTPATTNATEVSGILSKIIEDISDTWNIDLRVPCFTGECAQDWASFVLTESGDPETNSDDYVLNPVVSHTYGCDLWIEVTGLQ